MKSFSFYLGEYNGEDVYIHINVSSTVNAVFADEGNCDLTAGTGSYTKYHANNMEIEYPYELSLPDMVDAYPLYVMVWKLFKKPNDIYDAPDKLESFINTINPLNK